MDDLDRAGENPDERRRWPDGGLFMVVGHATPFTVDDVLDEYFHTGAIGTVEIGTDGALYVDGERTKMSLTEESRLEIFPETESSPDTDEITTVSEEVESDVIQLVDPDDDLELVDIGLIQTPAQMQADGLPPDAERWGNRTLDMVQGRTTHNQIDEEIFVAEAKLPRGTRLFVRRMNGLIYAELPGGTFALLEGCAIHLPSNSDELVFEGTPTAVEATSDELFLEPDDTHETEAVDVSNFRVWQDGIELIVILTTADGESRHTAHRVHVLTEFGVPADAELRVSPNNLSLYANGTLIPGIRAESYPPAPTPPPPPDTPPDAPEPPQPPDPEAEADPEVEAETPTPEDDPAVIPEGIRIVVEVGGNNETRETGAGWRLGPNRRIHVNGRPTNMVLPRASMEYLNTHGELPTPRTWTEIAAVPFTMVRNLFPRRDPNRPHTRKTTAQRARDNYEGLTKGGFGRTVDTAGRITGTGAVTAYGASTAVQSTWLGTTLQGGYAFGSYVAGSVISGVSAVAAPLGVLGYRQLVDARRHRPGCQQHFDATIKQLANGDEDLAKELRDTFDDDLGKHHDELIDTDEEVILLQALHKTRLVSPVTCPHLEAIRNYGQYTFAHMAAMCAMADGKTSDAVTILEEAGANGDRPQIMRQLEIALGRLSPVEQETLKKYNAIRPSTFPAEDEEKKVPSVDKRREYLMQASIAYGIGLQNYHREKREGVVTGATAAPAIAMTVATAPWGIIPGIAAGGFWGVRALYRRFQHRRSNLEFDSKEPEKAQLTGRDGGTIISPSVLKERGGGEIFQPGMLTDYKTKADLENDAQKYWLGVMDLRAANPNYADRRFKSAEHLGVYCAQGVQTALAKVDPPKSGSNTERITSLRQELSELQSQKDEFTGIKETRENSEENLGQLNDQIDRLEARKGTPQERKGDEDKLDELNRQKSRCQKAIKKAKRKWKDGKEIRTQLAAREKEITEELRALRDPKAPDRITPEQIGQNGDIRRAYAVKINQEFEILSKRNGWGKTVGKAMTDLGGSDAVKGTAKLLGETSAIGGAGAAVGYGIATAFGIGAAFPMLVTAGLFGIPHLSKRLRGQ